MEHSATAIRNVLKSSCFGSEARQLALDGGRGFVWVALFVGVRHVTLSRSGI